MRPLVPPLINKCISGAETGASDAAEPEPWQGAENHITPSLPARLTHGAVMLARPVSMATARCEGSTGKWLQWSELFLSFPFLAMVTVTGAEYIVVSAQRQL